jgi:hypothetical protein
MTIESTPYQDISGLGDVALEVVAARARRLDVLKAIDWASSRLREDRQTYHWFTSRFQQALTGISQAKLPLKASKKELDRVENVLLELQARAKDVYERLIKARTSVQSDSDLHPEESEELVYEFSQTIAAIAELHNNANDLRWAIAESDCNGCSTSVGQFKDVEELLASIK